MEAGATFDKLEFFDPFGEEDTEPFKPLEVLDEMFKRYKDNEVVHDYSADAFVADVWALYEDSAFVEDFTAMRQIQFQMAELCTHDHEVAEVLGSYEGSLSKRADEHSHDSDHGISKEGHDAKKCKRCQKGRYCAKK